MSAICNDYGYEKKIVQLNKIRFDQTRKYNMRLFYKQILFSYLFYVPQTKYKIKHSNKKDISSFLSN